MAAEWCGSAKFCINESCRQSSFGVTDGLIVLGASLFVIVLHALLYASETLPGEEFGMETV